MMNEEGTIERSARLPDENADVDIQKSTTSSGKRSSTTTKHTLFCFVPPWWHSTMVLGGPPWWFGGRQESRRAAKTVRRAAEISFTDRPVVRFLRSLRRILSCFPFFQTFTFFFLPFSLTVKHHKWMQHWVTFVHRSKRSLCVYTQSDGIEMELLSWARCDVVTKNNGVFYDSMATYVVRGSVGRKTTFQA